MTSEIPTVPAYRCGEIDIMLWCDWCQTVHHHGSGGGLSEQWGHRLAHCWKPGGPYKPHGYMLAYAGDVQSSDDVRAMAKAAQTTGEN